MPVKSTAWHACNTSPAKPAAAAKAVNATIATMIPRTVRTAPTMIAATANPFLCPALRLWTSATMPRIRPMTLKKIATMSATMPSVLPGTGALAGAPYGAGGAAE